MSLRQTAVCDHRDYCKTASDSIYLGQTHHLSYPPHRQDASKTAPGFDRIAKKWKGLCSYAGLHDPAQKKKGIAVANLGVQALCNIPKNTHSWQTPIAANPGFICARRLGNPTTCNPKGVFSARLGAKNSVEANVYDFKLAFMDMTKRATYSESMIAACKKLGMKPCASLPPSPLFTFTPSI